MKYNKSYLARRLALSLIIGGMFVSSAYALPQGGAVVGGGSNGNIGGSGNVMEITGTGSNNVAIKWEQFASLPLSFLPVNKVLPFSTAPAL